MSTALGFSLLAEENNIPNFRSVHEPVQQKLQSSKVQQLMSQLHESNDEPEDDNHMNNVRANAEMEEVDEESTVIDDTAEDPTSELLTKVNYMIQLLEEQNDDKVNNVTEELILYIFLGVFIILMIDSFAKVGKYVR
tara:strand:- start:10962 stop:11372 length:411 start_codon:yes stop_codon:yes gene_type:complete